MITKKQYRFNFECSTFDEIVEYFTKRARQMLKYNFTLDKIIELKVGGKAFFLNDGIYYEALYLYTKFQGKGLYSKLMPVKTTNVVTSDDCGIYDYLEKKEYNFHYCIFNHDYYNIINNYYGDNRTERSKIELMNHIDEGLAILKFIGLNENIDYDTFAAYSLHPLFQADDDLIKYNKYSIENISPYTMINIMEYRSVANEYLSFRKISSPNEIRLSPLKSVNDMLIADKIQNRKDFEFYHEGIHPRSNELTEYFKNWLTVLNISEKYYQEIKQKLIINPKIIKLDDTFY